MDKLTSAQQIFSLFYAIFFGTMLQTIGSRRTVAGLKIKNSTLNLFDSPNAWAIGLKSRNKPLRRFILSTIILNIIPGLIFAYIFVGLGSLSFEKVNISLQILIILAILWISLVPQYLYRFFYAILASKRIGSWLYLEKGEYSDYNEYDLGATQIINRERRKLNGHGFPFNHIAFPLFFYFPSVLILYNFLVPGWIPICLLYFSYFLPPFGILLFISKN